LEFNNRLFIQGTPGRNRLTFESKAVLIDWLTIRLTPQRETILQGLNGPPSL
jgi:hypothetical protein